MKFYFENENHFDILEKICDNEKIRCFYDTQNEEITTQGIGFFWGVVTTSRVNRKLVIDTDLEHRDFVVYLLKRELNKIVKKKKLLNKLETCYVKSENKKKQVKFATSGASFTITQWDGKC